MYITKNNIKLVVAITAIASSMLYVIYVMVCLGIVLISTAQGAESLSDILVSTIISVLWVLFCGYAVHFVIVVVCDLYNDMVE